MTDSKKTSDRVRHKMGGKTGEKTEQARALAEAAKRRALAEAAKRRADMPASKRPKESGGQAGLEPTRYGDWEKNGITSDF